MSALPRLAGLVIGVLGLWVVVMVGLLGLGAGVGLIGGVMLRAFRWAAGW